MTKASVAPSSTAWQLLGVTTKLVTLSGKLLTSTPRISALAMSALRLPVLNRS